MGHPNDGGMVEWVVELAGEDSGFSLAEMVAVLEAEGTEHSTPDLLGRHAIVTSGEPLPALQRLATAHRIFEVVAEVEDVGDLVADPSSIDRAITGRYRISLELTDGTPDEAVRTIDTLAGAIHHEVSLRGPDTVIKVIVSPGRVVVGRYRADSARRDVHSRDVMKRPFFSPVSIRSEFARALVNLSRVPRGGSFADPFCGGGGILLEAAAAGMDAKGIDIDPGMLDGARENLAAFGLSADLVEGDVSLLSAMTPLDGVATDPPYGRSTSLRDEGLAAIYNRLFSSATEALRLGGHLAVSLPSEWAVRLGEEHLELRSTHPMKVHRSLTRWFTVYRKV